MNTNEFTTRNRFTDRENFYQRRLEAGRLGEKQANIELAALPEEYLQLYKAEQDDSLYLSHPNFPLDRQQLDHIVVGPQGIFNIETKNWSGDIYINPKGEWTYYKAGSKQGIRVKTADQINMHTKMLRCIVGNDIPIINIVYLPNPNLRIHNIENSRVNLITAGHLKKFICCYGHRKNLPTMNCQEVREVFGSLERHKSNGDSNVVIGR